MNKNLEETLTFLDKLYPNASCELEYTTDYSFLIAVMLSAQTTDRKVNLVTREMFKTYKSLEELRDADIIDLEKLIMPLGMFHAKAKHVKEIANDLLERYDGMVPSDKNELLTLSGVGNKTANVVRCELFKIQEFPVDTHVNRVSKRLGFVPQDASVEEVEKVMRELLPNDRYIKSHHQFIHFGRYFCKAIKPHCSKCALIDFCLFEK